MLLAIIEPEVCIFFFLNILIKSWIGVEMLLSRDKKIKG